MFTHFLFGTCFCFGFVRSTICIYIQKNPALFFFLFQTTKNPKQRQTTQFWALNCSSFMVLILSESCFFLWFISSIITFTFRFWISLQVDLAKIMLLGQFSAIYIWISTESINRLFAGLIASSIPVSLVFWLMFLGVLCGVLAHLVFCVVSVWVWVWYFPLVSSWVWFWLGVGCLVLLSLNYYSFWVQNVWRLAISDLG